MTAPQDPPAGLPPASPRAPLDPATRAALFAEIEQEIPRLRRFARLLVHDVHAADDLVQETMVRSIRSIATFQPGTSLRAWLFRILQNVFRNAYRRSRRDPVRSDSDMLAEHPATAIQSNQETSLELKRTLEALDSLSDDFRQVILLCGVEGLQYDEAADVLGIPIGTVRSRLSRARAALRDRMAGHAVPSDEEVG
ncbi:RNA polymerase sigma factor [Zavarzinia sp. CC-PAN008]|uniref:RNA polymerase sigma factor n=1 Tax=Zavarzinia sp. CC-PAN008 TaxID=3243332 RepID=UPI003F7451A9